MNFFERQGKMNEDGIGTKHHKHLLLKIKSQRCLMLSIEVCNTILVKFAQKPLNIHPL